MVPHYPPGHRSSILALSYAGYSALVDWRTRVDWTDCYRFKVDKRRRQVRRRTYHSTHSSIHHLADRNIANGPFAFV
jgi:hypothetical protein